MGNATVSLNSADVLRVKDVQELRNLDISVAKAYLDGELMSRHKNFGDALGGWVSKKATVNKNAYLAGTAVVLGASRIAEDAYVGNGTTVAGSVLQSKVSLGDWVLVKDSWVSEGVETGHGADIVSSTILEDVRIGNQTSVANSRVGDDVWLGNCVLMKNKSHVLGRARIGDFTVLDAVIIFGGMEICERSVIRDSTIMRTRSGKIPPCSTISCEVAHGDLEVGLGRTSNLIDPPEDCLPVVKYGVDRRLDEALGTKR